MNDADKAAVYVVTGGVIGTAGVIMKDGLAAAGDLLLLIAMALIVIGTIIAVTRLKRDILDLRSENA